jgi:hypothetical protein
MTDLAGQPDWADEIAMETLPRIITTARAKSATDAFDLFAAALRDAAKRGAAEENARIYHTKEFGSGSTGPRT